ncbi:hypothetical protein K8R04_00755 [Candidatus Uhrbacteria bacterium]|nr:hypothetical protein [Candidatus Uhrbacteria bacterium]
MKPLISFGELLGSGWDQFIRDWKPNLELSIRFLGASLLGFIATLLASPLPPLGATVLRLIAVLAGGAIIVHTTLILTDVIRKRDAGDVKAKYDDVRGRALFWPFIWVMILRSLAVAGGIIAFVLPGIWMSIAFSFAPIILLENGLRGTEALAASHELVKGRWWQVFGRILASGFMTGLLMMLTMLVLVMVIGLFVGFDKSFALAATSSNMGMQVSLTDGLQGVLSGIVQAIFLPLGVIYLVKIYHSLKKTR